MLALVILNGIIEQRPQLFHRKRAFRGRHGTYLELAERVKGCQFIVQGFVEDRAYVAQVERKTSRDSKAVFEFLLIDNFNGDVPSGRTERVSR